MSLILAAAAEAAYAAETAQHMEWWGVISTIGTLVSMSAGLFFVMAGTIGVLRLPEFYTRLHAAGMTDTLGAELILFALILQADNVQMVLKLLLVGFFLFVTSPTATHAVAHAAYRAGLRPLLGEYRAPALEEDGS
jgi:multicomponent Na+:H+ antiporter subunit G